MTDTRQVTAPPTSIPKRVDQRPQCWRCGRVMADYVARPWRFTCSRCKAQNNSPSQERQA